MCHANTYICLFSLNLMFECANEAVFCTRNPIRLQCESLHTGPTIRVGRVNRFWRSKFLGIWAIAKQPLRGCSYKLSMLLTSLSLTNPPSGLVITPTDFPLHRYKNLPPDHQSHKFAYNITQTHRIAHVSICMFRYGSY